MGELVDDGDPDLVLEVERIREVLLQRQAEDRDRVREGHVVRPPLGSRDSLVEAVQGLVRGEALLPPLLARRLVGDDDRDLAERRGERCRDAREVAIVIADEPSREQRREEGLAPDETLYGLYEGVPRTAWGADEVPFPNAITIFRLPLEGDFPDPLELEDEVRVTVVHELAHHMGIDDDRLAELGLD